MVNLYSSHAVRVNPPFKSESPVLHPPLMNDTDIHPVPLRNSKLIKELIESSTVIYNPAKEGFIIPIVGEVWGKRIDKKELI